MVHATVKKPPEALLASYYELWAKGLNDEQLAELLCSQFPDVVNPRGASGKRRTAVQLQYISKHLPTIHTYCRNQLREKTASSLRDLGTAVAIPLTDERREQLLDFTAHGASLAKAANLLHVPLITITEVWLKNDEDLKLELECVRDRHDLQVVRALEKRALGYELDFKETRTVEGVSAKGESIDTTTVVAHVNHVPGSVEAQKLWLINRAGWSLNPLGGGHDQDQVEYDVREKLYDE